MKMRILYTLLLILTCLFLQAQNTQTITLSPTQDAYFAGNRVVNSNELRIKAGKQIATLKFDVSNLNITSARLELTLVSNGFGGELRVYEGDQENWDENNSSTSKPERKNDKILGSINEGSYTTGATYSWDLAVSDIEATDSLTLIVLRSSGSKYNEFASKENDDISYRPQLILQVEGDDDGGDDDGGDDDGGDDDDGIASSVWEEKEDGTIYYNAGNVGIGTKDPITKLVVDGEIRATKVRVRGDVNIPDYVFEEEYDLKTLEEVEAYIKANKHLPDVPSAKEVEAEGLSLGDMDAVLLKKVEELTLYIIELKKEIEVLKAEKKGDKD